METATMLGIADHLVTQCAQERDNTFNNYATVKLQNLCAVDRFLLNVHL